MVYQLLQTSNGMCCVLGSQQEKKAVFWRCSNWCLIATVLLSLLPRFASPAGLFSILSPRAALTGLAISLTELGQERRPQSEAGRMAERPWKCSLPFAQGFLSVAGLRRSVCSDTLPRRPLFLVQWYTSKRFLCRKSHQK